MTDIVTLSKAALKEQADLILVDNPGMSIDEAYGKALAHAIAIQCEQHAFDDPFKSTLIAALEDLGGRRGPISTVRIAVEVGGSPWQVWYHMSALQKKYGIVRMVGRRGWVLQAA